MGGLGYRHPCLGLSRRAAAVIGKAIGAVFGLLLFLLAYAALTGQVRVG